MVAIFVFLRVAVLRKCIDVFCGKTSRPPRKNVGRGPRASTLRMNTRLGALAREFVTVTRYHRRVQPDFRAETYGVNLALS